MTITTVGELIEALKQFERHLPVLKSDMIANGYAPLQLTERMVFGVKEVATEEIDPVIAYVDAYPGENGFAAVVL